MISKKIQQVLSIRSVQALLIIFGVVLASYLVAPVLGRSQNPIYQKSGLATVLEPGYLSGQNTIDPNDAFTSQTLGHLSAKMLLSGDMPYWNHYEGVGSPLAGGMQGASLFPPVILQIFGDGLLYFHLVLQVAAGIAAYLFFRKLKVSHWIALVGGVLFALNGTFAWLTNAPFNPIAFLPMLLLGIEYAISAAENKRKGGWGVIAAALALSLYAGFPETAFLSAIFAYGWGLVRLFHIDKTARLPYIKKVVLGSIIGLLLAAPILLPFLGYLPYATTGGHEGGDFAHVGLPASTAPALTMPYIFGPIFGLVKSGQPADLFLFWANVGGYVTVPLIMLAVFGLLSKRRLSVKLYLVIFSAVVLLKMYAFMPVSVVVNLIPGMHLIAFYRYSVPILSMALIMLAVMGMDALAKKEISKKRIVLVSGGMLAFVGTVAVYAKGLVHQLAAFPSAKIWAVLSVCWAAGTVVLIAAVLLYNRRKITLLALGGILVFDAFLMFTIPMLSIPKTTPVNYGPVTFLQQNLGQQRFYTLHPIQPNYGSYFETASININNLPVPKDWANYVEQKLDTNTDAILFTGPSRHDPNGPTALEEFARNQDNYKAVGVKYLVAQEGAVTSEFAQAQQIAKVYDDQTVEIYELQSPAAYLEAPNCALQPKSKDTLMASCMQETTLVRRELFMPGWTVAIDGKQTPVNETEDIFQSVTVPQGQTEVKFTYNPPHLWIGYTAFAVGVVVVGVSLRRRYFSDEQ